MFKRRKLVHEHQNRQQQETVSRSKLLTHPLLGRLSLQNQLGEVAHRSLLGGPSEHVAAYYTSSLARTVIYDSYAKLPGFLVDENNGSIIIAHSNDGDGNDTLHCLRPRQPGHYCGIPHIFEAMPHSFHDMSISTQTQKLLYVSNSSRGTRTVLLDVPKDGDDPHASFVDHVWDSNEQTAWETAASPTGESFAVASTSGLSLYKMLPDQMSRRDWVNFHNHLSCEFMAVAYGRDDRTVMAGKRSGIVAFFDARAQDNVARLRHEDAVSAIRSIDDNRIVVRGLQKMSLYDLRYTKAPTKKQKKSKVDTMPYRVFPWENISFEFGSGFDYSSELGIIGTVSSRSTRSYRLSARNRTQQEIDLFSVRTGKKLRSMLLSTTLNHDPDTCLKFSRIRSTLTPDSELRKLDNEPLSLLASSGFKITEWSCQGYELYDDGGAG